MYPRSTILGCFVLLILLIVTTSWGPRKAFLWNYHEVIYWNGSSENNTDDDNHYVVITLPKLEYICLLVSLPFLLVTFTVYSILPDLQNLHGYTLRAHVVSLFVTNVIKIGIDIFPLMISTKKYCLSIAYIYTFSILSGLFWLNVICFDTWWTLRQIRSYQRTNLKKREKKLFIIYSIYAWGICIIFNVVCAILDIPSISKHLNPPPEICVDDWFWFSSRALIYFFVPVCVSVIVNICLFIAMTLRIWYHDKQTANQLRNARSSDNKNKFTVYVKLSVVLGISWIMQMVLWWTGNFLLLDENVYSSHLEIVLWHIAEVTDNLQGAILFFAFVWKKKIMLQLQKRFGCQVRDPVNIIRNNARVRPCTSTNHTTPLTAESVPIQEISPSNQQINYRAESSSQ